MAFILPYLDDKPIWRVESAEKDWVKGYLIINFHDRKDIPRISRWKNHKVSFVLVNNDETDKNLAEFIIKGVKKRGKVLYLKINSEYMVKEYEV